MFQTAGSTIMIDAGPKTETFDSGVRIVVPELNKLGVRTIEFLIITHPDADHVGGLPAVARRFRIGRLCVPATFRQSKEMLAWLRMARIEPSEVLWLERAASARVGGFTVRMVAPEMNPGLSDNEGSMFVSLSNGKASAVLSGDAGLATEDLILSKGGDWRAQILKAGHHGSKNSSGYRWIRAVQPSVAIFSCGRNNVYGHPSPLAMKRFEQAGALVLRTDKQGVLSFTVGPNGFEWIRP